LKGAQVLENDALINYSVSAFLIETVGTMKLGLIMVVFCFLIGGGNAAELIVKNAKVYTLAEKKPTAEALVVRDGKVLFVGSDKEAQRFSIAETKVIDAGGGTVLPGFIDAHAHPALAGVFAEAVPLSGLPSERHILWRVEQYIKQRPELHAVIGFGWNPKLYPEGPRKERLDIVAPHIPVILIAADAENAWANTKALELVGVDENTPAPQEGKHFYHKDENGKLSGWLVGESAFWPHVEALNMVDVERLKHALGEVLPKFASMGVTTIYDAGLPAHAFHLRQALTEMEESRDLPMRYAYSRVVLNQNDSENAIDDFQRLREEKSDMHWPAALKVTNDGSIERGTARLKRPYNNNRFSSGETLFEPKYLRDLVKEADALGIPMHVQAAGDHTVHEVLNAIESVREFRGENAPRHALCHLQLVDRSDFGRFGKLGVVAQVSPQWMKDDDGSLYRHWIRALGFTRAERQFPFRSLWDKGAVLSMGSAYPNSGVNLLSSSPLYGIEKGMTRKSCGVDGAQALPPANQSLELRQLIQAATLNGAYQLGVEKHIGSLEVGKLADFIILDRDVFESPREELHRTRVLQTYVNGDLVYQIDSHGGMVLKE
jgi:predicted amidohydrolase YtcJ